VREEEFISGPESMLQGVHARFGFAGWGFRHWNLRIKDKIRHKTVISWI
jgi:hypothetical protein